MTAFSLNKPSNIFQSVTRRLASKTPESKLQREAWKLGAGDVQKLEDAVNQESFDVSVTEFSKTVREIADKTKSPGMSNDALYPLTAAVKLGMKELADQSDNPIIDMTADVIETQRDPGPVLFSLEAGLDAYQEDSNGNLFEVAGALESASRGHVTDEVSPYLTKEHPQVADHLELYQDVASFQDYPTQEVFEALGEDPSRPLAATMKDVLQFPYKYSTAYSSFVSGGAFTDTDETEEFVHAVDSINTDNPRIESMVDKVKDSLADDRSVNGVMTFLDGEIAKA